MKCPYCNREPDQTAFCYNHNPIGNCHLAKRSIRHLHHWCKSAWPNPEHTWIEVIKEDYENRIYRNPKRNDSISER